MKLAAAPVPLRREARRETFVAAARSAFFSRGYGASSMSAIAACVGGSKTTLWTYFPSKEALFAAVVDDLVDRIGSVLAAPLSADLTLVDGLKAFGTAMLGIVVTPELIDLHRLVVGEAGRFPELGHLFFERGPKRAKTILADFLRLKTASGELRADAPDAERLARQFAYMCQSNVHQQCLMGNADAANPAAIAEDVATAVTTFVAAWGKSAD